MPKIEKLVISGLLLLSIIPVVAGLWRMGQIYSGNLTSENARFMASPVPVVLHIISVTLYSLLGAFQFSNDLRANKSHIHRSLGKILIPAGLVAALSGLWMTLFYPVANFDGVVVYYVRLIVGVLMTVFILLGIHSIRERKFKEHGHWMIRAYALGLGAGTQVLTHIPWAIFPDMKGESSRAFFMTIAWVINALIAEWIIRNSNTRSAIQIANERQ